MKKKKKKKYKSDFRIVEGNDGTYYMIQASDGICLITYNEVGGWIIDEYDEKTGLYAYSWNLDSTQKKYKRETSD